MFSLYYYMNFIILLKHGKHRNYDEIYRIEDNYSFTLVIYFFSSVSLQLKRKTISLYYEENVHGNWI